MAADRGRRRHRPRHRTHRAAQRSRPCRGVGRAAAQPRLHHDRGAGQRGHQAVAGQEPVAGGPHARRILADDQPVVGDAVQQAPYVPRDMARRCRPRALPRSVRRRPGWPGAPRRRCRRPRRRPPRRPAPPGRPRDRRRRARRKRSRPWSRRSQQRARRRRSAPAAPPPTAPAADGPAAASRASTPRNDRERQQRPFGVVRRRSAGRPAAPERPRSSAAQSISRRASVSRASSPPTVATPNAVGRLDGAHLGPPTPPVRARRLGDPGQVRPRPCGVLVHHVPPACRKLSAVVTSSQLGDVAARQVAQRPRDAQRAVDAPDAQRPPVECGAQRLHHLRSPAGIAAAAEHR